MMLEFTFEPVSAYTKGVPQELGLSYIILRFPTVIKTISIMDDDFGRGFSDGDSIPCFAVTTLTALDCYLIHGDASNEIDGKIVINNYSPALTTTSHSFYIPWLKNPPNQDSIMQITAEVWEMNAALVYELMVYKEFKYIYGVRTKTILSHAGSFSYTNKNIGEPTDIAYTLILTNSLTAAFDEKVVWELSETKPIWTNSLCPASETCDNILSEHLIFMKPSGTLSDLTIKTLKNV